MVRRPARARRLVVILTAILAGAGLVCYSAVRTMRATGAWVVHTEEVLAQIATSVSNLQEAELNQRGYLLTARPGYLSRYDAAIQRIGTDVEQLRTLTQDNPRQQRAIAEVQPVIEARLAVLQRALDLARTGQRDQAMAAVTSGRGPALMDDATGRFAGMRAEEERLLALRMTDSRRATLTTLAAVVASSGLAVALLVVFTRSTTRYTASLEQLAAQLEARVTERTRELDAANADLKTFANSIAHDVRAPLRNMQGHATSLLEDHGAQLDPDARHSAERLLDAATRLDALVQDLLTYASVARAEWRLEPVRLQDVVTRALDDLSRDLRERRATVRCDLGSHAVCAHEPTLLQIVENLLSNAIKFVAPGVPPRITVRAVRDGERVRLTVRDNGIGFEDHDREAIFRMFTRLHPHERYGGTGVGLALVKTGIERMHGTVGVESAPAGGSTFWFELEAGAATETAA